MAATPVLPEKTPFPDIAPGTDTIPQIKHIVILMMEGHSYDNYLGASGRGDGFPLGSEGIPAVVNSLPDGQEVSVHHLASTRQFQDAPLDTYHACDIQFDNGANDGFAASVPLTAQGG